MNKEKFYNELSYYEGGHKDLESMFKLALEYIKELEEAIDYEESMKEDIKYAVDVIEGELEVIKDTIL